MVDIQCAAAEIKRGKEIEDRKKPYCLWNRADHLFSSENIMVCPVLLLIYLFTLAINLWHRKFVTADVTAVFVNMNNQHDIKRRGQDFDRNFVFEGVHSKEVNRRIS